MLTAKNIKKSYGNLEVLKGVDFAVSQGEVVAIVGPSGAGKSTLLHILGTLDLPESGDVWMGDVNISRLNSVQLSGFRNRNIGFVFQFHNLLPEFTAKENVMIPGMIAGLKNNFLQKRASELLARLGLSGREDHKPSELSGGEQQRVAVARALMNSPKLILADEPSGNLDSGNATELHKLFFSLRDEFGQTFIIVTHNPSFAEMADRTVRMRDGCIE
ncbi:MAG: ABC transporter ATP-binding protein [Cyclobacteriaceae bacterium]